MKKFFEYQLANCSDRARWIESYRPVANMAQEFDQDFKAIKAFYQLCLEGKVSGFVQGKLLMAYDEYITMIEKTYADPVIQQNIRHWARDPEFTFLVDHPSHDFVALKNHMPDTCQRLCQRMQIDYNTSWIGLQVQQSGYISALHIDARRHLNGGERTGEAAGHRFENQENADYHRWIVFLDDWKMGQVLQFGTEFLKWLAGDAFYWNVRDVPHALANIGYEPRFLLLIKGNKIAE